MDSFLTIETLYILIATFWFWVFIKLADAHDEHGMKSFYGAALLYGVLWGVFGAYMISFSPHLHALYLSILFYWIYKFKIDYINHAIGAIIMFLWAFLFKWEFLFGWTVFLLLSYMGLDYLKILNKTQFKNPYLAQFFRFRPQFIFWPVTFAIVTQDPIILSYYIVIYVRMWIIKIFRIDQD
ncbi:MAG: hypothetical protein ACD_71C00124G0008 [uncultured bacterium (gcode 4)]|uniref:Uncharacterized protein n=1 Tax=uncultured bacterium (gcode 4) TaxID=1234023 RepID=K1Z5C7_9BACT|nr:MAG: hypothetical protein ACD_71C00124G0008 [uncultured bacterium (gcode 4)]